MELSIIIINYQSSKLILDCLQTVYEQTHKVSFEVIVVDNNSQDNSRRLIQEQYPTVQWVQMTYNAGFSRANNAGIKVAKGAYVLLLNSDTLILDNALDKIVHHLNSESEQTIAASVQLLNADGSPQNAGNFFVKGGVNMLLTLPVLSNAVRKIGGCLNVRKPSITASSGINYVDWISGAFMLVKKSAIEKAGFMDEDFFLFSEEIEWCGRLRKVGNIAVFTDVNVIHLEGGTIKQLSKKEVKGYYEYWTPKGRQLMLSSFLRVRKQYSIAWLLLLVSFYSLEIPILWVTALFSRNYTFENAAVYTINLFSVLRYIPMVIVNKPYFYKVM